MKQSMIQQLSGKYQTATATLLFTICFNGMILPTYALGKFNKSVWPAYTISNNSFGKKNEKPAAKLLNPERQTNQKNIQTKSLKNIKTTNNHPAIGGPSQPEMSAFKSAGTDNMVNLFTGDFSYNIPLLDVGGYPVNIFYDGGVGMEQEASWVGLGWNINPGNVNRNMRGIPDDFNGEDLLTQTQTMKPNITWGVNTGVDFEVAGLKDIVSNTISGSLGLSFNNYLGPAMDIGIRGGTGLNILSNLLPEKSALTLGGSLSVNASSRSGVTFTPGISLTAKAFNSDATASAGLGLHASTSYNSRIGIKAMQISEQMSFNFNTSKKSSDGTSAKNGNSSMNANMGSSSISFTKPSYIPAMRMPLTNTAFSGHFQAGSGLFGIYPSVEIEVYKQTSKVAQEDVTLQKPMVGYLYMQNAANNANAVMDFTRVNDNEVTPSTPIISAVQYAYDVFSIQGEGTGGSIRAYRNDDGYVRDNLTTSRDKNLSVGADIGVPGHYGANVNIIKTPSTIGEWNAGNKLKNTTGFTVAQGSFENVYFRNPGESSVLNPNQYDRVGGINLVRYKLDGTDVSPTVEPILEKYSKTGETAGIINLTANPLRTERKKRTQVTSFLTAEEASVIGLDKTIKNYDGINVLDANNSLIYNDLPRFDNDYHKKHHISQINVTEANGQRYVYGIPVYNIRQKDFTFTVNNSVESANAPDKVDFAREEALMLNTGAKDGYLQITETPAFAHSFLLSGLLSPDYVDVTNNGITEDDLGNAVKFNYSKMTGISKWRTPLTSDTKANFNAGKRTESKDDKGIVSYGERESWYLHSIESKTMIAIFKLENRNDSKGSMDSLSGINTVDNTAQRLKQIDLYNKADLKKNGLLGAKPIKTVHFEYTYNLCKGAPNNSTAGEGKLTLEKIYFTFNGQAKANRNQYVFGYASAAANAAAENPDYDFNASDRWGTYKPALSNPASSNPLLYPHANLKNSDYPYSIQDKNLKTTIDQNAGAWMLKKILLPSGGQMQVTYESDDYAFVQNKRAAIMMKVLGFGKTIANYSNQLYEVNGTDITENNYAFIQVPDACNSKEEVFQKYLSGIQQLSFKLAVYMPKGMEFLHSYATIDADNYGLYSDDASHKTIWVKLNTVDNLSPLSLTAIEFLREQLPGQAYTGYDISDNDGLAQVAEMFKGWFDGIKGAFSNPVTFLRQKSLAQTVDPSKCFVRLNDPDGVKYGGGYRVKSVRLKDNWQQMNGGKLYTSEYGQDYDYTTTEIYNGVERTISSGVASYEPSLGGDENPFQTMVQVSNKVPLGPASYGAIEMPVLDAFFPAASVGYSKVTVTSIKKGVQDPLKKSRSGIGKQVTEYYTAKDFPIYYCNTGLDPLSDKQANSSSMGFFFYKYAFDSRALSQGFLVETNDMHGKMKSQASYPENDDKTPLNYTQNFYRNTGSKGFDEKFNFVYANQGGMISQGNMGIDVELMTDTREFSVKSNSLEIQGQVDLFPVIGLFPWLPFIWPVVGESDNTYRAVTTTKVVSYHSILESVVVIDKGSQVSTKNTVFDAETGEVIVNVTNNEFNQPVYSTNYPAWWAYSGMGLAYKNIDATFSGINFSDGKIQNLASQNDYFESGDELLLKNPGKDATGCVGESPAVTRLWAFDKNKDVSSLTNTTPEYYFLDSLGRLYSKNGVTFKIVRSGKRNMLSVSAGSVISMNDPVINNKINISNSSNVINASAVEFKEKWQTDNDVFKRYVAINDPVNCTINEVENCIGYLEKNINPYVKGLLGTFRISQSKVFYDSRKEKDPLVKTNIPANGFLDNFKLYWDFNLANNLVPDATVNSKWVWNSQVTKLNSKGLELETKNALNIYTAAQYGFNKTVPVAISNNSQYNEMFNEGFEDNIYDETLNGAVLNPCFNKHIDFNGLLNGSIVNSDQTGFNAHTGKNMLSVNANTQVVKALNVSTADNAGYDLKLIGDATKVLSKIGGDAVFTPYSTNFTYYAPTTTNFGVSSFSADIYPGPDPFNYYTEYGSTYIKIVNKADYNFHLKTIVGYNGNSIISLNNGIDLEIYDLNNNLIDSRNVEYNTSDYYSGDGRVKDLYYTINLCPGIYNFVSYSHSTCQQTTNPSDSHNYHLWECSNCSSQDYQSLTTVNGCNYTKPIPAEDNMINPTFSLAPNKKMQFSAWVHEDCATIPCLKTDFNQSNIEIWSDGVKLTTGNISHNGAIIEGWQKIEGEFTLPANATTPEIRFINTNDAPMYVDDIRIHPFNANMKSYVYDPVNLRLVAELDANNYASFYEYDDEGTLIRTKIETKEGIKTVTETRSAKQKGIITIDL